MEEALTISFERLQTDAFWQGGSSEVAAAGGVDGPPSELIPRGTVAFATSGSTGEPSWIVISKESLLVSAAAVNERLGVQASSRWGLALPLHHVGGFGVVARAWQARCACSFYPQKWEPHAFCDWMQREKVTHVSLVPTQVHDLVRAGCGAPDPVIAVVVGGGELSEEIGRKARDLGWPVLATYGMTETASQVATQGLDALDAPYVSSPLPVLGIWNLGLDAAGCFRLSGPALFCGRVVREGGSWRYVERAEDWFVTRDLGSVLPDGGIRMEGRADELVKVLGELVSPARVESMIRIAGGIPESVPFAIVAVPDPRKGHRLVAVAEDEIDLRTLARALEQHNGSCPGFLRVEPLVTLSEIPRSALGKVRREALRSLL